MRRLMALALPFWPAERRSRAGKADPDAVRLVVATERGVRRVDATCPRGDRLGIRRGMPLAEARVRIHAGDRAGPAACVEFDRDVEGDLRALRRLGRWLLAFVPTVAMPGETGGATVEPDPEGHGLLADLSGCGRWLAWAEDSRGDRAPDGAIDHEAERRRLERIRCGLSARGITARLAIAGTAGAAWAVARFAKGPASAVIPPGGERVAIEPLPVECLRLSAFDAAALREVEVRTVGELIALDRDEVADRFGPTATLRDRIDLESSARAVPEGPADGPRIPRRSSPRFCGGHAPARLARACDRREAVAGAARTSAAEGNRPAPLRRLDEALGRMPETLVPLPFESPLVVSTSFAGPVRDAETIAIACAGLIDRLCRRLSRGERAVRSFRIRAFATRGEPWTVPVELGHATRRPGHLWSILRPMIESLPELDRPGGVRACEGFDSVAIEVLRSVRRPLLGEDRTLDVLAGGAGPLRSVSAAECIDTFVARLGPECLLVARPDPGHRPEGIGRLVPRARLPGRGRGRHEASWDDPAIRDRGQDGIAGPTWRPPRPEPVVFIGDAAVRWRGREHEIRRVGAAEILVAPWWRESPSGERLLRRLERLDGLGLWIERDRDAGERLSAADVVDLDRLDAVRSPACRLATWRLIGIGA